ncbi:MAG TPA: hypothetical protein VMB71_07725 [Acetobacteraceae bacterium]|nr:hypothetical protein [Acetobacteraceae bacterium]
MSRTDDDLALLYTGALVPDNPLATHDQRELESLAITLVRTPEVAAARARAALLWLSRMRRRPSSEAMACFEEAVAEHAFHSALNAANSDSGRPRVLKVQGEPHRWFGMDVPGARRGGNNPDNAYRIIPVDGSGSFEIIGERHASPPTDVTVTLIANTAMSKTVRTLEQRDITVDKDGLFRITIDPHPARARRNHLQSTPDSHYLFVRDTLTDWTRQRANRLVARRLDTPPEPPDFGEMVRRAAAFTDADAAYYWDMCMGQSYGFPVNTVPPVRNAGAFGGLVSQSGSTGHLRIDDDEAFIVTVTQGRASYLSFAMHDPWWRTLAFAPHTASLNNAQFKPDADGAVTFVVATSDPGVHNWIDTSGCHEGIFYLRWQGLPPEDDAPPIVHDFRLVKRTVLETCLPHGVARITPEGRAAQHAARTASVGAWWRDS